MLVASGDASGQQLLFELAGDNVASRKLEDLFGAACVGLGDVDGDGVGDLLVGSMRYNTTATRLEGAAFLFSGATQALIRKHLGSSRDGHLGRSLDGGHDVDGDGTVDYVVGEPYGDSNGTDRGFVRVYSGATGVELWTFTGERAFDRLGESVALIGDVDGDGQAEIVASAYTWDNNPLGVVQCGRAYCWSGRTGALLWTFDGVENDQWLKWCTELSDLTGDGIPEVGLGSFGAGVSGTGIGKVEIVDGSNGSLFTTIFGAAAGDAFGFVQGAGDVDGDGTADLLVGSLNANANRSGRVAVHSGASGHELFRYDGAQKNETMVVSALRGTVDWNRDGFADFLIGSTMRDCDDCSNGIAWLYSGRHGRLLFEYRSRDDLGIGASLGSSISVVGDLTGDAIPELLIGAPHAGPLNFNDGRVYVFAGDDLFLQADQSDYDNGDPIAIELRGGTPGVLGLIAVTAVDGASLFVPLLLAPLDAYGELAFTDVTDPAYLGHSIEIAGWCLPPTGRGLLDSNLETFKF